MSNFTNKIQNYYNWTGVRVELIEILTKLENLDKDNLSLFKKTHPFRYLPVNPRRIQQFIDLSLIPKPNGVKYSFDHILFYFYTILMRKKGYSFNQLSGLNVKLTSEEAEQKLLDGYNKKSKNYSDLEDEDKFLNPSELSKGLSDLGRKEGRALYSQLIRVAITPWCHVTLTKKNINNLKKEDIKILTSTFENSLFELFELNKQNRIDGI